MGSITSLMMPKTYELKNGEYKPNSIQKMLWKRFVQFTAEIKTKREGRILVVASAGESIEGIHHQSTEVISQIISDQIMVATDVWDYFLQEVGFDAEEGDKLYFLAPTDAHAGTRSAYEEVLANDLDATPFVSPKKGGGGGLFTHPSLSFTKYGVRFLIQHHAPVSSGTRVHTKGNALRCYLRSLISEYKERNMPIPDYFIFGHYHQYIEERVILNKDLGEWGDKKVEVIGILAPCWQAPTTYIFRIGKINTPSTIGGIYIEVNQDGTHKHYVPFVNLDFRPSDVKI